MIKNFRKLAAVSVVALAGTLALAGCSDAEVATQNLATAADNFEVQRHIVGINAITDTYVFEVVGRCSITHQSQTGSHDQLEVVCKHGPNEYKAHKVGLANNVSYVAEQLDPIDVSVYHTKVIIKPEALLPEAELSIGKQ